MHESHPYKLAVRPRCLPFATRCNLAACIVTDSIVIPSVSRDIVLVTVPASTTPWRCGSHPCPAPEGFRDISPGLMVFVRSGYRTCRPPGDDDVCEIDPATGDGHPEMMAFAYLIRVPDQRPERLWRLPKWVGHGPCPAPEGLRWRSPGFQGVDDGRINLATPIKPGRFRGRGMFATAIIEPARPMPGLFWQPPSTPAGRGRRLASITQPLPTLRRPAPAQPSITHRPSRNTVFVRAGPARPMPRSGLAHALPPRGLPSSPPAPGP